MKAITALAFDFGTRRIGLAVGNSITGSSQALAPITTDQDDVRFALIAAQIKEWAPDQLVVGLPCHPDAIPRPFLKTIWSSRKAKPARKMVALTRPQPD